MNNPNEKQVSATGTLFLVATPIGNLDDITARALKTLASADAVYCEDTRRTMVLFSTFEIKPKENLKSFHDHSPRAVVADVRRRLEAGQNVAYATDGGMPVISDPGYLLVQAAAKTGAPVVVVPGPSAAVMVFAASGLASPKYLFHGFFPRVRGEVERVLEHVRALPVVHIFYEAPGRVLSTFEILNRNLPQAEAVLGRELTKMHEEWLRGSVSQIHAQLAERGRVRGECTIAILGGQSLVQAVTPPESHGAILATPDGEQAPAVALHELTAEQQAEIRALVKSGVSSKDTARALSKKFGVSRKIIYEFVIRRLT